MLAQSSLARQIAMSLRWVRRMRTQHLAQSRIRGTLHASQVVLRVVLRRLSLRALFPSRWDLTLADRFGNLRHCAVFWVSNQLTDVIRGTVWWPLLLHSTRLASLLGKSLTSLERSVLSPDETHTTRQLLRPPYPII